MSQNNCYFIKNMLDTMLNPICYKDRNGIYVGVNRTFARQIAGLPEDEIIGYTLPEMASKIIEKFPERAFVNETFLLEHVADWGTDDTELLNCGGAGTHEYEGICADGIKRTFLVNKSTFDNEEGEIAGLVTVLQDITELDEAEKKLEKNEERYRVVTTQTGQIVFDYDITTKKISWSGATRKLMGFNSKNFESTSLDVWLNRVHPEERGKIWQTFENCIKYGENLCMEYRFRRMDESYAWIEEKLICLKDENGDINRALGVMKDINERKLVQERLEVSEENYRSFIQDFKGIAFQLNENFLPEFMHGQVEEITGYSEEEFLLRRVSWVGIIHPEDLPLVLKDIEDIQASPYNLSRELDFRIIHKNGIIKWIHQSYQKAQRKDRRPYKYQGTAYDITEKKEAEKALENLEIARRREMHHRIKNNLQVISSLLDLQAEKFRNRKTIKASEVLEGFRESQDRVMSIALIHKELHQGGGDDELNFSLYLEKLAKNLFQTYRVGDTDISLNLNIEDNIFFDTDIAVPLGMTVNELVSNSLKYAFKGRGKGKIQIKLFKEKNDSKLSSSEEESARRSARYTLIISDNGSGIPEIVNLEDPGTLGLQLVNSLVDQLDGKIKLKRNGGTRFTINFNATENYRK